jgi:hypothetical protein
MSGISGPGGKPRTQATQSQKGKVTSRQNPSTEPETQEWGKTRAGGTVEIDEDDQEIRDAEKGKSFFEERLLLVPHGEPVTLDGLSMTLFQVAAMQGMSMLAVNAVHAVAFLLREFEVGRSLHSPVYSIWIPYGMGGFHPPFHGFHMEYFWLSPQLFFNSISTMESIWNVHGMMHSIWIPWTGPCGFHWIPNELSRNFVGKHY